MLSLSFTILNTFETKKGIIKNLVYSSVIDIIQMWFFLAMIITSS